MIFDGSTQNEKDYDKGSRKIQTIEKVMNRVREDFYK